MTRIYIAYRAADAATTQRIYERAVQVQGAKNVIINPDIPPMDESHEESVTPEQYIRQLVLNCDVVLVIIGRNWTGVDEFGRFLLSSSDMPLHAELYAAFGTERSIMPVLIDGVRDLPPPDDIPEEFQGLYDLVPFVLRPQHFAHDLNELIPPPNLMEWVTYFISLDWLRLRKLS